MCVSVCCGRGLQAGLSQVTQSCGRHAAARHPATHIKSSRLSLNAHITSASSSCHKTEQRPTLAARPRSPRAALLPSCWRALPGNSRGPWTREAFISWEGSWPFLSRLGPGSATCPTGLPLETRGSQPSEAGAQKERAQQWWNSVCVWVRVHRNTEVEAFDLYPWGVNFYKNFSDPAPDLHLTQHDIDTWFLFIV